MPIKMKELPETERPYEKLEQYGEKTLTNAEDRTKEKRVK